MRTGVGELSPYSQSRSADVAVNLSSLFLSNSSLIIIIVIVRTSHTLTLSEIIQIEISNVHNPNRPCAARPTGTMVLELQYQSRSSLLGVETDYGACCLPRTTKRIAIKAAKRAPPTLGLLSNANEK